MAVINGTTNIPSLWTFKFETSEGNYNIANNTSPLTVKVYLGRTANSGSYMYGADIDITVGCTGCSPQTVNYRNTGRVDIAANGWLHIGTATFSAVPHNDDGAKIVYVTASFSQSGVSPSSGSAGDYVTLATIPRQANITSCPDSWKDNENPTIEYSNPAGNAATTLQACISLGGSKDDIAYRDISKTGNTYTFPLTDAERAVLQKATVHGSTSRTIKFFVKTVLGGVTYYSDEESTLTIVDCMPTLSPTITDTNPVTTGLTNNPNTIVRHASIVKVTTGASAPKHGTITSQAIICGPDTFYGASATINNPKSGVFRFIASDNRGQQTVPTEKLTSFIEYVELSCSQRVDIALDDSDDSSAIAKLTISGNYFKGSFGASSNTLELWYRYKEVGTEWSTLDQDGWRAVEDTVNKSDNTYSTVIEVAGLEQSKQYIFQCRAVDAIYTGEGVTTGEYPVKVTPVFDWGNDDFNFNVPVTIMGSPITPSANRYIYSTPGIAGSSGYIKMARLTHRKANADTPITFVFTRRLEASPMTVHVQFKSNSATTDPDLKTITYEGSNYGAFIVRVATSVWDLYVQKVSAYDTVTLHTWFSSGTVDDRLTVEFPGDLASALPSGLNNERCHQATPIVLKSILDCFMPVGFVLTLYSKANPNTMYPGTTWERIQNTFLWGCDESGTIGQTGGEKTHTLTVNEIPAHSHELPINYGTNAGTRRGVDRWNDSASLYSDNVYTTKTVGGGAAHNNMPPYTQVSIWRRTA